MLATDAVVEVKGTACTNSDNAPFVKAYSQEELESWLINGFHYGDFGWDGSIYGFALGFVAGIDALCGGRINLDDDPVEIIHQAFEDATNGLHCGTAAHGLTNLTSYMFYRYGTH